MALVCAFLAWTFGTSGFATAAHLDNDVALRLVRRLLLAARLYLRRRCLQH